MTKKNQHKIDFAFSGLISALAYALIVAILHSIALNLPRFTDSLRGPAFGAVIFFAVFLGTMLGAFWPHLRSDLSWFGLFIPILIVPLSYAAADMMFWGAPFRLAYQGNPLHNVLWQGFALSMGFQAFASFLVYAGIKIGKKHRIAHVRKTARDEEELMKLFEMRKANGRDDLSWFQFKEYIRAGYALTYVSEGLVIGFLIALRKEDSYAIVEIHTEPPGMQKPIAALIFDMKSRMKAADMNRLYALTSHNAVASNGTFTLQNESTKTDPTELSSILPQNPLSEKFTGVNPLSSIDGFYEIDMGSSFP